MRLGAHAFSFADGIWTPTSRDWFEVYARYAVLSRFVFAGSGGIWRSGTCISSNPKLLPHELRSNTLGLKTRLYKIHECVGWRSQSGAGAPQSKAFCSRPERHGKTVAIPKNWN
jgi:hypothetical protein